MAYGLIRVRNLHFNELRGTEIHNLRLYSQLNIPTPDNIREGPAFSHYMGQTFSSSMLDDFNNIAVGSLERLVNGIIELEGIKTRKNSVVAIEYVVSASRDYFKSLNSRDEVQRFLDNAVNFVKSRHGHNNTLMISYHYDEGNPHAHVVVIPIKTKFIKWKNRNGEGFREEKRLAARDFTGGKDKLRKLQDDYFEFCRHFENDSVKFYRGTKAEEQLKHYTKRTNYLFNEIRNQIQLTRSVAELQELLVQNIKIIKEHIKTATELQKRIEIRKERNKNEGWKKGRDFELGF